MQLQSHLMRVRGQISRKPAKLNYQRVAFCRDFVWLASLKSGLLHALKDFADAYDIAGMKISTSKTKVLHLLRNPIHSTHFLLPHFFGAEQNFFWPPLRSGHKVLRKS